MPNPSDTDPGSLDATDAVSRHLQAQELGSPEVMPARLPSVPARRLGRRVEVSNEVAVTTSHERLSIEPDPAPLPPSPAAADANRWLERERPRFDTAPTEIAESSDTTRPVAAPSAVLPRTGHSTTFTALLAITTLVIGMILGALVFGR